VKTGGSGHRAENLPQARSGYIRTSAYATVILEVTGTRRSFISRLRPRCCYTAAIRSAALLGSRRSAHEAWRSSTALIRPSPNHFAHEPTRSTISASS
jgi:hypothetical protein